MNALHVSDNGFIITASLGSKYDDDDYDDDNDDDYVDDNDHHKDDNDHVDEDPSLGL